MGLIKRVIKSSSILTRFYRLLYRIIATIYWNLVFLINKISGRDVKYGSCFVFTTMLGRIKKNNWGDDLNEHLFSALTDSPIRFVPFDQLFFAPGVERYSLIGSIIGDFNLDHTIIYGSGSITSSPKLQGTPQKVLSVRGPLTRKALLDQGIECPAVYGDPALLLPMVYKPKVQSEDLIGVVPHYRTTESDWISALKKDHDVLTIDMSKYDKWTDIVDLLAKCKVIISESLHGLIVAEAYGIPAIWVEFVPHNCPWEWEFKYQDFYKSIGKDHEKCYKLYEGYSAEEILNKAGEWTPGTIDYDSMLKAFPFKLKGEFKR